MSSIYSDLSEVVFWCLYRILCNFQFDLFSIGESEETYTWTVSPVLQFGMGDGDGRWHKYSLRVSSVKRINRFSLVTSLIQSATAFSFFVYRHWLHVKTTWTPSLKYRALNSCFCHLRTLFSLITTVHASLSIRVVVGLATGCYMW